MAQIATLDESLFLPEPEARPVWATVISVDDHFVEPPHTFEGRIPARLAAEAPQIVETKPRATRSGASRGGTTPRSG